MNCTSCNINIKASDNFVKFTCPSCNEEVIIRCSQCKAAGVKYRCKKCDFVGP